MHDESLAAAWCLLAGSCPSPQPVDDRAFDEWSDLVEAESALVGVVATAMAGGGVDHSALARVRRVVGLAVSWEHESPEDGDRLNVRVARPIGPSGRIGR